MSLLRDDARFRAFWCGQTVSLAGDEVGRLALPLVGALALGAGPAGMGVLTAAGWLPSLLLSLHAGVWVDRSGRRREAMIAADLGRAALLAAVPVAWALGALTFAELVVIAFATGALGVVATLAGSSLHASLVARERLVEAGALVNGSRAGAAVLGPSAGGVLVTTFGAPFALIADAVSFLASAAWLKRVKAPPAPKPEPGDGLAAGARFIARSPLVRPLLAATATLNLFMFMVTALLALYVTRTLGVAPAVYGSVLAAAAVGGLAGSVLTRRISATIGVGSAFALGCVLFPAPVLLIPLATGAAAPSLALLFVAELISGFGVMVLDISVGAILSAAIPEALRARVFGAYQVVNYGVRPLGALGGGALGALIGMRPTLALAAAGATACVLWLLPSPVLRLRTLSQV